MEKRKLLFYTIFTCVLIINTKAQNIFHSSNISVGFALQKQDKRLFEFPNADDLINSEVSNMDTQFELLVFKEYLVKKRLILSGGIGYSLFNSKFSRPFNQNYFTGLGTYEGRLIESYNIHCIQINNIIYFPLISSNNNTLSLLFPVKINFAFNKEVKGDPGNWHENKGHIEFYNLEFNSGINYRIKKIDFSLSYRLFNWQKIDKVIFNFILFKPSNQTPAFLQKKSEMLNLNKLSLNFGYSF